jgi:hypothetical protein
MKFVMAGRIFFVKKIILSFFWTFQNGKNNKLFVFKKYENLNQKQNML